MALLTQSETLAFNGFLSSVDFADVLEWSSVAAAAEGIDIPPAPEKGKEAILAKAAKGLMSLEPNLHASDSHHGPRQSPENTAVAQQWPSHQAERADQQQQRRTRSYTYGFGTPSRHSHRLQLPSHNPPGGQNQPIPENGYDYPRSQSPQSSSSASPFGLNPPTGAGTSADSSAAHLARPSPYATSSAPSVLAGQQRSSSSKRSLPTDSDSWPDGSNLAAGEPANSKRRRPSAASQPPFSLDDKHPLRARGARPSSSSSSTVAGSSSSNPKDAETATISGAAGGAKPTLLSPSQKRANHIQSEQKRRANIRKGYEALCEAVPALREAIKQEEEAAARVAEEEASGRSKRKRKAKGAASDDASLDKSLDGRAGPKSENVVLQKTIDHLHALLAEQATLKVRLVQARGALPQGHPALPLHPDHMDEKGIPLWEREWSGGTGWNDNDDDGDDE